MRRIYGICMFTLVLAACNGPATAPVATPSEANPAADAPTVQSDAASANYNRDFPEGLQMPFEYTIRSRKVEEVDGAVLRKLVIEFRQGDAPTVDKQVEELLVAKGYKRYKTLERGNDLVGDYGSDGKRVTVTTTPVGGSLQLAEGSLGTIYFVWKD
ncbi:hypothetical protein [uncultured Stenotrophomonas sp.]|uniref:hypothetical protein n=1 Tax=uncultured Stenotrophomonas sp. TaxID=165438 RepID=UPI0025E700F2|nr:hypothetical protein [uncultured Stenotrophomonas sp.]